MATVPNHSQAARIGNDLKALLKGEAPKDWQGNSYSGRFIRREGFNVYILTHWNTEIAAFAVVDGAVKLADFRGHYYSATTRSFQGRILKGMSDSGVDAEGLTVAKGELSKPTGNRGHVAYDLSLGAHSIIG